MKTKLWIVTLTILAVMIVACGPADDGQGDRISLDGTSWKLVALNGEPPLEGTTITAAFSEGEITGNSGCNSYAGSHTLDGNEITFDTLLATEMACLEPEGVMEQETTYLETLRGAAEVRLTDGQMEMLDESGAVLLRFERQESFTGDPAQLVGTEWELLTLDGSTLDEEWDFTLAFAGNRYSGLAGCRHFEGSYEAGDGEIRFADMTMLEEECPAAGDDYYALEGQFTDCLTWARHWRIAQDQLEIRTERGEVLIFTPITST